MKKNVLTLLLIAFTFFFYGSSLAQATYVWNQTGTADWTLATNWSPNRTTPALNDVLVFSNAANTTPANIPTQTIGQLMVSNNTIVNLQGAAAGTVLTISGLTTGADLTVDLGSQLNINVAANNTTILVGTGATASITGNMTFSNAAHRLDAADANVNAIVFNSPAIFTQATGCTGNVFTANPGNNTVIFSSGTTFVQTAGANPFALAQPASKVVFQTGSLYKYQQNSSPSLSGRTYADLEINAAGFNQSATGANPLNIDNLTITQGSLDINLTGAVNIKGNILVAASQTLTFTPASPNTLSFNGTTAQSITNNGTLSFGTNEAVTINNAAGLTVNSSITWQDAVNFTSGVVTVPNPAVLTLGALASAAGASNTSYVDGLVQKIGSAPFSFPVGKPGYGLVPLIIDNYTVGSLTSAFTVEYKRVSANSLSTAGAPGLDHVSDLDHWTVENTGTDMPVANVTLSWNSFTSNNGSVNYITFPGFIDLTVARYNPLTNAWDSYGGTGNILGGSTAIAGAITWTNVSMLASGSVAGFSLASTTTQNPLPVIFDYLLATKQPAANALEWKLSCGSSKNVVIELQRAGVNKKYITIETVNAAAAMCQQAFYFTDISPLSGTNNYRIKVTDDNGKVSYSTVAVILNSDAGFDIVSLLPNMVTASMQLNVTSAKKTRLDVVITDALGRTVTRITYSAAAGSNVYPVNTAGLPAGMYQLTAITTEGIIKTTRFVKQ